MTCPKPASTAIIVFKSRSGGNIQQTGLFAVSYFKIIEYLFKKPHPGRMIDSPVSIQHFFDSRLIGMAVDPGNFIPKAEHFVIAGEDIVGEL